MSNDLQKLLAPPGLDATAFPPNSRYHGIETKTMETTMVGKIVYVKRRIIEAPESLALLQIHSVVQGDRLDLLAHQYLGDPEQFWRLCDANGATRPRALMETVGRKLRITLP